MDGLQANNAIKRILENANRIKHNTSCTLIDGGWGIGKTYLIQNYFDQDANYELIYVSLFGKNTIKEIENSLLINLIPGFKNVKDFGGFAKLFGTLGKDLVGKFAGVNIENYLNSFSIEDFKNNKEDGKRKVICFDDLERKSDAINMKDLLGLIERATVNFEVILITNTKEISGTEIEIFNVYREKVIDHVIRIDKPNKSILKQILESTDIEEKDEIIEVYLENVLGFGKSPSSFKGYLATNICNLRIFVKYIELALHTKEHMKIEKLDWEILRMCKIVVYNHYFPNKGEKKASMNFDKFNIYNALKKILLFENIDEGSFKEYFRQTSEVRQDIKTLYNLYRLNEEELTILIKKIDEKIKNKELNYFIDQTSIISLGSALEENKMLEGKRYKELLRIAIDIYAPEGNSKHASIKDTSWNSFDMHGNEIECNDEIKSFIEELNSSCEDKHRRFIDERIYDCIQREDFDAILDLINFNEIDEFSKFEDIFNYYFCRLENRYSQGIQEKIEKLIHVTKSEVIKDFFVESSRKERSLTNKKKYQYFDSVLDTKMYHESQVEAQIEYLTNYPQD